MDEPQRKYLFFDRNPCFIMAKVILDPHYLKQLEELDGLIRHANERKLAVLLEALGQGRTTPGELEKMLKWELITFSVPDKQMAVQLNKLSAYMPKVLFVVDTLEDIFTVKEGFKSRRVRKGR